MGLLDSFTTDPDQQSAIAQGLLSGGFSMLANSQGVGYKPSIAAVIGQGGTQGLQTYNAQRALQARLKEEAQQRDLRQLQIGQMQDQIARQKRIQDIVSQSSNPAYSALADGADNGSVGPTIENAQRMQQPVPLQSRLAGIGNALLNAGETDTGLDYLTKAQSLTPKPVTIGADQRLVTQNPDGTYKVALDAAPKPMNISAGGAVWDPATKATLFRNPSNSDTGGSAAPRSAPGALASGSLGSSNQHGADYLASLPRDVATQVQALAEGRMAFPSSFAMKSPYWQQMLSAVAQYDPGFDQVNYGARAKTRSDFMGGSASKNLTALNTAIGHLKTLADAAEALGNSSFVPLNTAVNYAIGQAGDPRVTNFDMARNAVADELMRVFRQAGASDTEAKAWKETISGNLSPQQLRGAIAQAGELLNSRVDALNDTYNRGMGTTADTLSMLSPKARKVLDALRSNGTAAEQTTAAKGAEDTQSEPTKPQTRQRVTQVGKAASFGDRHLVISGKTYQILGANPDGSVRIMDPATGKTGTYKE